MTIQILFDLCDDCGRLTKLSRGHISEECGTCLHGFEYHDHKHVFGVVDGDVKFCNFKDCVCIRFEPVAISA